MPASNAESTQETSRHTIAIVGAGFTGAMVAVNLLRFAKVATHILLIERCGRFSAGVAYGTGLDAHLLNVPAGRMSAFPDDPDHFRRWASARDSTVSGGTFVPRRLYGEYLADLLDVTETASDHGKLERITAEACGLQRETDGRWGVKLSNGVVLEADAVVLSIGNYEPANPPVADPQFYESDGYVRDPWARDALNVEPDAPVLLLGTGLTMLDIAIALKSRGHRGLVHAVSRRGLLPQPHRESAIAPLHHDRPADIDSWEKSASGLLRALRREVEQAATTGVDWREVVTSIRHDTPALWQNLPNAERRRFLRHLRSFWETHRHRSAPATTARIDALRAAGQLQVHTARVHGYKFQNSNILVTLQPRGRVEPLTIMVQRVINCTGPDTNLARVRDPLIQDLRAQALIRPDELGLGLDTDPTGALVNLSGTANTNLYLVGPLRKGQLWENTAVPELRVEAMKMAQLLAQIGAETTSPSAVVA